MVRSAKPPKKPANHHRALRQVIPKASHTHKLRWHYVVSAVTLLLSVISVAQPLVAQRIQAHRAVLAYATDVSSAGLLSATNVERAADGVAGLVSNNKLAQAAQAKADDMVARNYWSHNTPEGSPPWIFFTQAGYAYVAAGENLAYGFTTSSGVIGGWMNSPSHKENVLNAAFQEVGFGYANAPDYQGNGQQTIVVAMYGKQVSPVSPPPSAVAKQVTPPTPPPVAPPTPPTPVPVPAAQQPSPVAVSSAEPKTVSPPTATTNTMTARIPEPSSQRLGRLQVLLGNGWAWAPFGLGVMSGLAALYLMLKHGILLHHVLKNGQRFVLHHPFLDIAAGLIVVLSMIASQASGYIR